MEIIQHIFPSYNHVMHLTFQFSFYSNFSKFYRIYERQEIISFLGNHEQAFSGVDIYVKALNLNGRWRIREKSAYLVVVAILVVCLSVRALFKLVINLKQI